MRNSSDVAFSLASTKSSISRQRARTVPHAPSWQRASMSSHHSSRPDNVPQFVRSYLDTRRPAEKLGLKRSHFIPDVLHPKPKPLPEAGAAVPASSLALLKRRRNAVATYVVSADLVVGVRCMLFVSFSRANIVIYIYIYIYHACADAGIIYRKQRENGQEKKKRRRRRSVIDTKAYP